MTPKIRLEGNGWNWKEVKKMMKESLELSEELGQTSLYVPKGNPAKLGYGRFKPRVNRLTDGDIIGDQPEEGQ